MTTIVQHLVCNNDRNGNPRRVWMQYSDAGRPMAFDEGYAGRPYQTRQEAHIDPIIELPTLEITVAQYKEILAKFGV